MELRDAKVLLVDDQPDNLDMLSRILEPEGYNILVALDGRQALDLIHQTAPDLVLLDVMMPGIDGFETCRRLKDDPLTRDIPVIFLTARTDSADVVTGFQAGGVDYIAKPFSAEELRMRVVTQLRLRLLVRELTHKNEVLETEIAQRRALTEERDQLADRLTLISDEEAKRWGIEGFVGRSKTLEKILAEIARLQQAGSTSVLINGESGTGKELIARAIHFGSERAEGPFVPVNCSAIPSELADSLFFGHVKGAFTGADRDRVGYFELADGGTLFLDEIGDMPLQLQAKLLRALEDRRVLPVGGDAEKPVDVRVLSATNADLATDIQQGRFRQDLYYRLASFPVEVPPLRERQGDIPLLAQHFLELFAGEMRREAPTIAQSAIAQLQAYAFPGNIRELKNIIERALIESGGQAIETQHLHLSSTAIPVKTAPPVAVADDLPLNLRQAEIALIRRALKQTDGNIAQAARLLGTSRMKIYRRVEELTAEDA